MVAALEDLKGTCDRFSAFLGPLSVGKAKHMHVCTFHRLLLKVYCVCNVGYKLISFALEEFTIKWELGQWTIMCCSNPAFLRLLVVAPGRRLRI